MATPSNLLQMAFASGIDESQEDEILDPTTGFLVLQNGRQDRRGGYTKRLGFAGLTTNIFGGGTLSAGARLFMNGKHVCCVDSGKVYVYSTSQTAWVDRGRVPECSYRLLEAPSVGAEYTLEDVVANTDHVVLSYRVGPAGTTASTYRHAVVVLDKATGAVVRGPEVVHSADDVRQVRLAAYGNYVFAFTCSAYTDTIQISYLTRTSLSSGWTALSSLTDFRIGFDCGNVASNDRVAIAYGSTGGSGQRVVVKTLNISGVVESVNIATASTINGNADVTISEGGDVLWVAYHDGTDIEVTGLSPSDIDGTALATNATMLALGSTTLSNMWIEPRSTAQTSTLYVVAADATAYQNATLTHVINVAISGGAATAGTTETVGALIPIGRPFLWTGRHYAHAHAISTDASTEDDGVCVLVDLTTAIEQDGYARPVANPVQRGLAGYSQFGHARVTATDTDLYVTPLTIDQSGNTLGARLCEYDFGDIAMLRPTVLNGTTYLGGGLLASFDGVRVAEVGFLVVPATPQVDPSSGTGMTLTNGRRYVATLQQLDAAGRWHISGVSAPSDYTGAVANKQIVVRVPPCSITARADSDTNDLTSIRVVVYATLNSASGNPPYYRLGSVQNDPTSSLVSVNDTLTDAFLSLNELLYSTGSLPGTDSASQDHRAPAGWADVVAYNGMLVGIRGANVEWTAQNLDGEGAWWSPLFSAPLDDEGVGLTVQDGSVIIFTKSGAMATSGDAPSDNGQQGGLATPRKLSVDHPCINRASTLATDIGTFYQSSRGIELLTRGQTVKWIGEAVQRTLASYPLVTSAVFDSVGGYVRFSLSTGEAAGVAEANGRDLVFDMSLGSWVSVDSKRGSASGQASQDACMVYLSGAWRYAWLATDGTVYYERSSSDASAHLDGSTWITMAAESSSFKASGIHGRQHLNSVLALIRKSTDFDVSVSLAYDFGSFETARTWTDSTIDTLLASLPALRLKHLAHDKAECQGVRVRIADATPTGGTVGSGKGGTWLALGVDVTPLPGAYDVPEEAA